MDRHRGVDHEDEDASSSDTLALIYKTTWHHTS